MRALKTIAEQTSVRVEQAHDVLRRFRLPQRPSRPRQRSFIHRQIKLPQLNLRTSLRRLHLTAKVNLEEFQVRDANLSDSRFYKSDMAHVHALCLLSLMMLYVCHSELTVLLGW